MKSITLTLVAPRNLAQKSLAVDRCVECIHYCSLKVEYEILLYLLEIHDATPSLAVSDLRDIFITSDVTLQVVRNTVCSSSSRSRHMFHILW